MSSAIASTKPEENNLNDSSKSLNEINTEQLIIDLATLIFDIGLKTASPKIIMSLMPECSLLRSEHIKSHLQKYRIQHTRSQEEFLNFFNENILASFLKYESENYSELSLQQSYKGDPTTSRAAEIILAKYTPVSYANPNTINLAEFNRNSIGGDTISSYSDNNNNVQQIDNTHQGINSYTNIKSQVQPSETKEVSAILTQLSDSFMDRKVGDKSSSNSRNELDSKTNDDNEDENSKKKSKTIVENDDDINV
jgi:hypothetical protein